MVLVLGANLIVARPTIVPDSGAFTNAPVAQVIVAVTLVEVGPRARGLQLKR